uniref:Uncharacterized protein n=1 Tax=Heterorhabditis bacteriophora TaxID=37862 RepID=A0A1I7WX14_HETBA
MIVHFLSFYAIHNLISNKITKSIIIRSKLPKKRRRVLQPHEIKPIVGRSTTAVLLNSLGTKPRTTKNIDDGIGIRIACANGYYPPI